jgi:ABC-2 type transport system ATP-binding protein
MVLPDGSVIAPPKRLDHAVTARDLTCRFGDFVAVDRVSFQVRTGEIFGFLGPNGAGKTTTIKMLAGLIPPTSGQGLVAGLDVATERRAIKRSIGYMSQLFSLYADLTVDENILFFSRLYGVPRGRRRERADWVVELAGLGDHRRRLTGELPLGWKQRLALGCAVLHEPPILFLDEPTSGVDPISRRAFWDLIYGLGDAGTTVFVTTHYMEEAEYCNRLALLNRGRLIALDTAAGLRAGMSRPIFEVRSEAPPRAVKALDGAEGIVDAAMYGRTLHVTTEAVDGVEQMIRAHLSKADIAVASVKQISPSLEDVFVSRVRDEGGARSG